MTEIVLVTAKEWEGLYIDGRCVNQNNPLFIREVIEDLGGRRIELNDVQEDRLIDIGYLPDRLMDL